MTRIKPYLIFFLLPLTFSIFFSACEKKIEEEIIQPVEMMVSQKGKAASLAAVTNVQTVRAALLRFPANSPTSQYPGDMDIYDYAALRELLVDENLPSEMAELMWDPAYGVRYQSDGYTFTFKVRTFSGETITATPGGISKN